MGRGTWSSYKITNFGELPRDLYFRFRRVVRDTRKGFNQPSEGIWKSTRSLRPNISFSNLDPHTTGPVSVWVKDGPEFRLSPIP